MLISIRLLAFRAQNDQGSHTFQPQMHAGNLQGAVST
jgi:hypothetical protein